MSNWKKPLKRAAQSVAAVVGRHRWNPGQPVLLVLTYHRVLPAGHNDLRWMQPGMVVSPQTLSMHIQVLREYFELVDLSEWTARVRDGAPVPAKACALTFDDGWRDNFEYAFPVLREQQAPATIFIVTDMMDGIRSFWPERLARLFGRLAGTPDPQLWRAPELAWLRELRDQVPVGERAPDRAMIDTVIVAAKRWPDAELEQRLDIAETVVGFPTGPAQRDMLTWQELGSMTASQLVRVGSHTRRHRRLRGDVRPDVMLDEVIRSKELIRERLDATATLFCYPNGDWSPDADRLVRQHYSGACLTTRGWNRQGDDLYRLRRIGIHEDIGSDRRAFLARISSWV